MKTVISRSIFISLVLSILVSFTAEIMFLEIQVPKSSYDSKKASSLTVRELSEYNEIHMDKLTGIRTIPYFFNRLVIDIRLGQFISLIQELKIIIFLFITIFLGCLWLGAWQRTKN